MLIKDRSKRNLSYEECVAIVRIHSSWPLGGVNARALECLDTLVGPSATQRVHLGQQLNISSWVDQGLGQLAIRDQDLTVDERSYLCELDLQFLDNIRRYVQATSSERKAFKAFFPAIGAEEPLLSCTCDLRPHVSARTNSFQRLHVRTSRASGHAAGVDVRHQASPLFQVGGWWGNAGKWLV
jgi:hypothetical protein